MDCGWTAGEETSLARLLDRRERRAAEQRELLARGGRCLVSFTMNLPGLRKRFPLAAAGFREGVSQLRRAFGARKILAERRTTAPTGDELLLLLDVPPREAKTITAALEEAHPLGRLWDMDVLDPSGKALSRTELGLPVRRCLLCGRPAKVCARSRSHKPQALFRRAAEQLAGFFRERAAEEAGACAVRALLAEVSTTPKPGLVDRSNSGAHRDMDFFTFLDSTAALAPWFRTFFLLGWDSGEEDVNALFQRLRRAGQQAEADMFAATGGVNTHKGLVFSTAILLGALGRDWAACGGTPPSLERLSADCGALGRCALGDFTQEEPDTAGLRCFREHRITGVRGEAAAGFPSALAWGLPALEQWLGRGAPLNDAACAALLALLAHVTDTNMIRRRGPKTAGACRRQASGLLETLTPETLAETLAALDQAYIRQNLSPGGCADLLALSLLFHNLRGAGFIQ